MLCCKVSSLRCPKELVLPRCPAREHRGGAAQAVSLRSCCGLQEAWVNVPVELSLVWSENQLFARSVFLVANLFRN